MRFSRHGCGWIRAGLLVAMIANSWVLGAEAPQAGAPTAAPAAAPVVKLIVTTDRAEAVYGRGEKVEFALSLMEGNNAMVGRAISFRISKDGIGNRRVGTVISGKEPVRVDSILGEPGFLRCDAWAELDDRTKVAGAAAAGVEPLEIKPSMPVPEDFDYFWEKKKDMFGAAKFSPVLTKLPSPNPNLECYDVQIELPSERGLSAFLVKPVGAKPSSLPAILYTHGAGVRGSVLKQAIEGAKLGAITVDFNAHGVPNGQAIPFYESLRDGDLKDIYKRGVDDPDKIYFLELFRRMMAAMRFLTSQPEWDGQTLIVYGSSQGGGMAVAAAALEPRVSLVCASVPGICDHSGMVAGRVAGWPKLLPKNPDGTPDAKALELSRYYDGVNFASRVRAQVVMSVGFIDRTCPPTSVFAAFNAITGKKRMITRPTMDHLFPPDVVMEFNEAVVRHIALKKALNRESGQ